MTDFVMTVGLEVHVELKTQTKIFCSCRTDFGAEPNTQICPICMGLPGALPRLNRKAVEYAIRAGLVTNCQISELSTLDRKNYFYPDLPKAFQISQNEIPLCRNGYITLDSGKKIGITQIHIEEDAGKLIHTDTSTLIDYNRCGTPLIEIVGAPDIHSASEAKEYLKKLRALLLYAGISDCKMNEGSIRCDVNISVAKNTDSELGTRTEIKNINSFSFVAKAIDAEYARQCDIIKNGGQVECQTRRFNSASSKTELMRKKESRADYRFFTEPDLMKIKVTPEEIKEISQALPMLPHERKQKYIDEFSLSEYDSELLVSDISLSDYFEQTLIHTPHTKVLANLLLGEFLRLCDTEDFYCPIPPKSTAELVTLYAEEKINSTASKKLVTTLWQNALDRNHPSPTELAEQLELWQINDEAAIQELVCYARSKNPRALEDYKNGKTNALKAIIGSVMSASSGRANPRLVEKILFLSIK